jgi:hypothetical protein
LAGWFSFIAGLVRAKDPEITFVALATGKLKALTSSKDY